MNSRLKVAVLLFLFLLLGLIMGVFMSPMVTSFLVPASHKAIVDSMTVADTSANVQLTPKLLESSNVECAKGLSVMFTRGKQYPQTIWVWERYGDVELVMCIRGPDDTGKTYGIEISRLAWDPFVVKINGVTKLTIEAVTSTAPAIGYYQLEVSVKMP